MNHDARFLVDGPIGLAALARAPGRVLLAVAAIALGVAMGYAIHLLNRAAIDEFDRGLRVVSGAADAMVRGAGSGFAADVYARVARHPDVRVASPVFEFRTQFAGLRDAVTVLGIDALRAGMLAPALLAETADGLDLLREDAVFLAAAVAAATRTIVGDVITVPTAAGEARLRVAGLLGPQGPSGLVVVMDIAGAHRLAGVTDRITRIDVRWREGVDPGTARGRLLAALPPGLAIESADETSAANAQMSRAYRVNLTVLALVALFTGGMLVFSVTTLTTAHRRTGFAILRMLGVTRRQLAAALLAESLAIGAAGAATGIMLGAIVASIILGTVGGDLGAGYFRHAQAALSLAPGTALAFAACGMLAAVAGSLIPVLDAVRDSPSEALRAAARPEIGARGLDRPRLAIAFVLAGLALAATPPLEGLPLGGYAAIACLLLGVITALPRLCRSIGRTLAPRAEGANLDAALAVLRLARAPAAAAIMLAALVSAVSLTVSMVIMVSSFRASVDEWLVRLLPADLYLRTAGEAALFSVDDQARIAAIDGVARAEFLRQDTIAIDPTLPRVTLIARDVTPQTIGERLPLIESVPVPPGALPAWVSEVAAGLHGWRPGDRIELALGEGRHPAIVAGVWRDYGRTNGAIVIERARYMAVTGDARASDAGLWYVGPGDAERVSDALAPWQGRIERFTAGDVRRVSLAIFDRTFAVTYGLEVVSIVIGLAGLSAGFGASVAARRREFGVLRHLGATRRRIRALLATEGAVVAATGVVIGVVTGWLVSFVLIHVVNRQSFHWSMDLHFPAGPIALFGAVVVALAAVVAAASGRRAMQGDAVAAVREDW